MSVYIQDSARNNVRTWMQKAISDDLSTNLVLSPFVTPPSKPSKLPSAEQIAAGIQRDGGTVWLDPMTHALQAPGVGNWTHYDRWNLWETGIRGLLDTPERRKAHLKQVFAWQRALNAPLLAPTILLISTNGTRNQWMLDLCKEALEEVPKCALGLAGDTHFWSQGRDLDAFIGSLAQLETDHWFLTVFRPTSTPPPSVVAAEVHGVCRSVRSLQEDAVVHLSYSDFAGLPGLAAGASSVGTGWDPRQRTCGYNDFVAPKNKDKKGGSWFERPTLEKLLCLVSEAEFELLKARNQPLALALRTGDVAPGTKENFYHHLRVLANLSRRLTEGSFQTRYEELLGIYDEALTYWGSVRSELSFSHDEEVWIEPYLQGLRAYGEDEGWN